MAVKFLLLCLVFAAYILDIETHEVVMVPRFPPSLLLHMRIYYKRNTCKAGEDYVFSTLPRGVGGGNSNFLTIELIITGIICLVLTCSVIQCCCSKCFPDKNNIQAERAMLFAYLRALHYNKQSTADGQIGPCEQMGSSQLKLDTLSQMTLNNADDSKEPTATSDIESRPWEQVGSPQLKLDTRGTLALKDDTVTPKNPMISDELSQLQEQVVVLQLELDTPSTLTLNDVNVTQKNPMRSDEQSQLWEQMMALKLELDTVSTTTPYDANIKEETSITLYE